MTCDLDPLQLQLTNLPPGRKVGRGWKETDEEVEKWSEYFYVYLRYAEVQKIYVCL